MPVSFTTFLDKGAAVAPARRPALAPAEGAAVQREAERLGVYAVLREIGSGSFGSVSLVRCMRDLMVSPGRDSNMRVRAGERYAMKAIRFGDSRRRQVAWPVVSSSSRFVIWPANTLLVVIALFCIWIVPTLAGASAL